MSVRDQDRLGLYFVSMLVLLAIAMCLSALFGARSRNGGRHAASWENPRGSKYELSQQIEDGVSNGAHSGRVSDAYSVAGGGAETSALMPNARNERAVWRSLVAQRGIRNYSKVVGSNPITAPDPKQLSKRVVSAQQKESATRLASVALSVTGSVAAQPGSIRGAI